MPDPLKPLLRAVVYGYRRWRAGRVARRAGPHDRLPHPVPVAFLFGCGRSGTTAFGRALSLHPEVCYLFEPGYAWAAIDRRTDSSNFYHRVKGRCIMSQSDAGGESQARFARLVMFKLRRSGRQLLLEKTPINAMRIDYLEALAPGTKFVHIVRDGIDVCRSINRVSTANTYRIAGRRRFNQWWGSDGAKWEALARDGAAVGYYVDEIHRLHSHLARGAYEWLVTQHEVDRCRAALGDRLLEIRYPDLTADPTHVLAQTFAFLGLETQPAWLEAAGADIGLARSHDGSSVVLPASMCTAFNDYQRRFGFDKRAVPADG